VIRWRFRRWLYFRVWWRRHWYGSDQIATEIEGRSYEESDEAP
jgi:hypothetical protein